MINQNFQANHKQIFSRTLNIKSQNPTNKQVLITKQFINNLKLQISQKIKPSKSILQALKHSNTVNQNYKAVVQQLSAKVEQLTQQNAKLKSRVLQLQQSLKQRNTKNIITTTSFHKKCESQFSDIYSQAQQNYMIEIQLLIDKVKHLQQYKSIKQERFQEIIERQAQYVGEINILKYQNQNLQSSIQNLKSSLQIKLHTIPQESQEQQRIQRKKSEESQRFKEYINHSDCKQDISIEEVRVRQANYLVIPTRQNILLHSFTNNVEIQQVFNLEKMAETGQKLSNKSFVQIDYILGEDLSSSKTLQNVVPAQPQYSPNNLNNSIIAININQV